MSRLEMLLMRGNRPRYGVKMRCNNGVTLMELIVVVLIVDILAAAAIPLM